MKQKAEIVTLPQNVTVASARPDYTAPGETDLLAMWAEAFRIWMSGLKSENTRRAYRKAWNDFQTFTEKTPWRVGRADVEYWVEDMRMRGLSDCTRQQRLAAISAFYTFVRSDYTVYRADGREESLYDKNPAEGKRLRPKIEPYGKATYLGPKQVKALLRAIKKDSVQGLRDYALFLAYLFTGRRNSEIRLLQWGNITEVGDKVYYVWSGKGKKDQKFEMPTNVYVAIKAYLKAAGRLEAIREGDYIFTALSNKATRLPNVNALAFQPGTQPLSMREVGRLLKVYCKRGGLDPKKIHVHTLRHTAAMLRSQAGDDVKKISAFLAHSSLGVTGIYLHRVEGQEDDSWMKVETLLGL